MAKCLMIDDQPAYKITDRDLSKKDLDIALSVKEGIEAMEKNPVYERLYLDMNLGDGSGIDVLTWLSDHMDKVPKEIIPVSFGFNKDLTCMIGALMATKNRN